MNINKLFILNLFIVLVLLRDITYGQATANNQIIDSAVINNWENVQRIPPIISNDGKFFVYSLYNSATKKSVLVIQSTTNLWKKEVVGALPVTFSSDSKQFIYATKDTLCFFSFEEKNLRCVGGVKSWKQPKKNKGSWLAWQLKEDKSIVLQNLINGKDNHFSWVTEYSFDDSGYLFLTQSATNKGDSTVVSLSCTDLTKESTSCIWSSDWYNNKYAVSGYKIDGDREQIAFSIQEKKNDSVGNTIWYYRVGMNKAVMKLNNKSKGIRNNLIINSSLWFSNDGQHIFFTLSPPPNPKPKAGYVKLDIWSYRDTILQCTQLNRPGWGVIELSAYLAVVNIESNQVIQLVKDAGDFIKREPIGKGDFIVLANNTSGDRFWLKQEDVNFLVSLKNGSRTLLKTIGNTEFAFSPKGKYLVYFDAGQQNNYFSFDLQTGKVINISVKVPINLLATHSDYDYLPGRPNVKKILQNNVGIAGWKGHDEAVLVYDNYDIWQLDLTGKSNPLNLTNGYGSKHKIKFRLVTDRQDPLADLPSNAPILLSAFNMVNKYNGFYQMFLDGKNNPEVLTMGPYTYFHSGLNVMGGDEFDPGLVPMKAKNSEVWIVKRQSATEAPNYYLTSNFKSYSPLTNVQPQTGYNWLRTELVTWKQPDGIVTQGVLYKPQDFDPHKKYPIIFTFYQQLSHRLYEYPQPGFTTHQINIPWFVSNGYLVFTPDIHFTDGKTGECGYTTVVSAAKYLSKQHFVDSQKMAIVGHSFSGQIVNYIITHANMFAAAIIGAGTSDQISSALQLSGGVKKKGNRLFVLEGSMNASIWDRPDLYLAESSVLRAHKVSTPAIIFHSMIDGAVPWEQGVEMFMALWRLEKRAWMLQYDEGDHGVGGKDAIDYTIRINQYFDHYLKGAPPPKWMTSGIRASMKGIETGYELDPNGSCGKDCKICKEKKYNNLNN